MHFSLATIAAVVVTGAQLISATPAPIPAPAEAATNGNLTILAADFGVNIGATFNNVVAWVDGQSKCTNVVVAASGTNFCGQAFKLNGKTFKVNGCGGSLWLTQGSSNTFWANCGSLSEADACSPSVHTNWHCL